VESESKAEPSVSQDSTEPARSPPEKEPLTFGLKKSAELEVTEKNSSPSASSTTKTNKASVSFSYPSTSMTSMTSIVSEIKLDAASVHWEEVIDPLEFSDSEISSDNEADDVSVAEDVDKRQLDSEWLHLHWTQPHFVKREGVAK